MRTELVQRVNEILAANEDALQESSETGDVYTFWHIVNNSMKQAIQNMAPQLHSDQQYCGDKYVPLMEHQWREIRLTYAARMERMRDASLVHLIFLAWHGWWQMRIAWHHVTHARTLAAVKWKQHLGELWRKAEHEGDARELWRLSYSFTTRGLRPRNRWAKSMQHPVPPIDEWLSTPAKQWSTMWTKHACGLAR